MSIEFKNVSKRFGNVTALDNVSLSFEEEKIYGLLGRNGAGKSTLLNILTSRIFASSGEITVDGENAVENDRAMSKIYLMSEKTLYPESMNIKDALRWSGEFYPSFDMDYAKKIAGLFSLDLNKKVKSLSTGYGSIFKLVIALSVNTPYIIFDEPVLGLDANHRDLFYKLLIEKYAENPSCIVISTHLIEEISHLIEDVVIIKEGRIMKQESRESLMRSGYAVSGTGPAVDKFISGKQLVGQDILGGLKTAYVMGDRPENVPEGLEISAIDLQKLFIQLTSA